MLASAAAVMGSVLRSGQSGRFAMPLRSLSREEVRQVDEKAIAMGLPGVVLMENAALGLTDVVCDELAARDAGPGAVVGIITGKGNNGGDGFVLARHLVLRGYVARVAYCGDRSTCKRETDAGINLSVLESSRMAEIVDVADGAALASLLAEWSDATILVDAIYGTGLCLFTARRHRLHRGTEWSREAHRSSRPAVGDGHRQRAAPRCGSQGMPHSHVRGSQEGL